MIPAACFNRLIDGWQRPTSEQISAYLDAHGISNYRVAQLIGCSQMKAGRWRKDEAQISYADWRALVWEIEQES